MNKKLFFLIFALLFLVPFSFAHFPESHIFAITTAMNDNSWGVGSALKSKVLAHPNECMAGLMAIDSSVIYYLTEEGRNKVYGGTHSIKWLETCNSLAGNDESKQVFCLCGGLHLAEDITSHGYKDYQGYTSLCLSKYASTNLFLHSICERAVVNDLLANLDKFPNSVTKDEIRLKTCDSYDILIAGDEDIDPSTEQCTNPYVKLLSQSAGTNLCQAVHIVGSNLKMMCDENKDLGSGYTEIYRTEVKAPTTWKWIALIAFLALTTLFIVNIMLGKTKWKWIANLIILPFIIISIMGIYYGFFNVEQFYHDYNFIILDPFTTIIKVPDWENRMAKTVADTKSYLSDPNFQIPKVASGLNFYEGDKLIIGSLNSAELVGRVIFWAGVIVLSALLIWIEVKAFKGNPQRRRL